MSEHKRKALFISRRHPAEEKGENVGGWRWNRTVRYVSLIASVLLIAPLFPRSSSLDHEYELNSVWSEDTLRAPFAFPLYKDDPGYERDVKAAREEVLPIYVPTGMNSIKMHDT